MTEWLFAYEIYLNFLFYYSLTHKLILSSSTPTDHHSTLGFVCQEDRQNYEYCYFPPNVVLMKVIERAFFFTILCSHTNVHFFSKIMARV